MGYHYAIDSWIACNTSSWFRLPVNYTHSSTDHSWQKYSDFRFPLWIDSTIDPTKIIITGKRLRFSFIGISDIIYFDPNQTNQTTAIVNYQQVQIFSWMMTPRSSYSSNTMWIITELYGYLQEDLTSLGKLILALACRCLHSVQEERIQSSISLVSRTYSSDLRNLVL